MPLRWTISDQQRLVTIVAEGFLHIEELEECYDAMVVANALSYARLFDGRKLDHQQGSDEDFMRLGARMSAYVATLPGGPLALVVTTRIAREFVDRYLNLTPAPRPVNIFRTADEARRWLDVQPH